MKRIYYSHYQPAVVGENNVIETKVKKSSKFFTGLEIDDLILIAIIFILITDEHPDFITILALIYIFLV